MFTSNIFLWSVPSKRAKKTKHYGLNPSVLGRNHCFDNTTLTSHLVSETNRSKCLSDDTCFLWLPYRHMWCTSSRMLCAFFTHMLLCSSLVVYCFSTSLKEGRQSAFCWCIDWKIYYRVLNGVVLFRKPLGSSCLWCSVNPQRWSLSSRRDLGCVSNIFLRWQKTPV